MIAPQSRTPTISCTCARCEKVGTHGTMVAIQWVSGGARTWFCPSPCLGIQQRLVKRWGRSFMRSAR